MNDKELADKVVALGVGKKSEPHMFGDYMITEKAFADRMETAKFVRDWRVAGALLEKCEGGLETLIALNSIDYLPKDANLARELTEVCVVRLS